MMDAFAIGDRVEATKYALSWIYGKHGTVHHREPTGRFVVIWDDLPDAPLRMDPIELALIEEPVTGVAVRLTLNAKEEPCH